MRYSNDVASLHSTDDLDRVVGTIVDAWGDVFFEKKSSGEAKGDTRCVA